MDVSIPGLSVKAVVSYDLENYQIAVITVEICLPKKFAPEDQSKLEAASQKCPEVVS